MAATLLCTCIIFSRFFLSMSDCKSFAIDSKVLNKYSRFTGFTIYLSIPIFIACFKKFVSLKAA